MLSFDEIEDCCPDGEPLCGPDGRVTVSGQWLHDFAHAVAAKEREACAKLCESEADEAKYNGVEAACLRIADDIRKRHILKRETGK